MSAFAGAASGAPDDADASDALKSLTPIQSVEDASKEAEKMKVKATARVTKVGEDDDSDSDDDLHPLFWTDLPKGEEGKDMMESLSKMIHEGKTPSELALHFKELGNENYVKGTPLGYSDALEFYKQALDWSKKCKGTPADRACYASILSNRAAINLKKKNFRSVMLDCRAAIKYGPQPPGNCKAHYRYAKAAFALGKYAESKKYASEGLGVDPESKPLQRLRDSAEKKRKEQAKKKAERERAAWKKKKAYARARNACRKRSIQVGPLTMDIERYSSRSSAGMIGGAPLPVVSPDEKDGVFLPMLWASLFIYPEHSQTDYVSSFRDDTTFAEQLINMFPPTINEASPRTLAPWDRRGEYTLDSLEVYFEERYVTPYDMSKPWEGQYEKRLENENEVTDYSKKHWVKVDMNCMLGEVLIHPNYVVPGIPMFYVVSKRSEYYSQFMEQTKGRLLILKSTIC